MLQCAERRVGLRHARLKPAGAGWGLRRGRRPVWRRPRALPGFNSTSPPPVLRWRAGHHDRIQKPHPQKVQGAFRAAARTALPCAACPATARAHLRITASPLSAARTSGSPLPPSARRAPQDHRFPPQRGAYLQPLRPAMRLVTLGPQRRSTPPRSRSLATGRASGVRAPAQVIRDGEPNILDAVELVPGDLVEYQEGDQVRVAVAHTHSVCVLVAAPTRAQRLGCVGPARVAARVRPYAATPCVAVGWVVEPLPPPPPFRPLPPRFAALPAATAALAAKVTAVP
jgi:hypothetical protein